MAEGQAVYKIRVDGDDDLVRAGDRVEQRWSTAGNNISQHVGGAVKAVGQGMLGLANDAIRVATAMNTINIGSLVNQTRELGMSYTKFAVGSKQQLGEVKAEAERAGKAMLMDPGAVNLQARAFGGMTYSIKTATKDLEALNEQATANNRDLGAELPLGAALRKMIGPSADLKAELERVRGEADALGYSGGPAAFADMIATAFGQVSLGADDARGKVTSFLGALTKDLPANVQKEVGSSLLSQLQGRSEQISDTVGYDIRSKKTGLVENPQQVYKDLYAKFSKQFQGDELLRVMRRRYGDTVGTAIANAGQSGNWGDVGADPSKGGEVAQLGLVKSKAGQREQRKIVREGQQRDSIGEAGLDAQDAFGGLFDGHPLLGQVASWALGGLGSAATGYAGAKLAGNGAVSVVKGTASAALGEVPKVLGAAEQTFETGGRLVMTKGGKLIPTGTAAAQAEMAAAETFGKTALSYGSKGLVARGLGAVAAANPLIDGAMFQAQAFDSLGKDSDFAQGKRADLRASAAKETAGRIARGGYHSIEDAAADPQISKLVRDAGVGKEAGTNDTWMRIVDELRKMQLPDQQLAASVENAFVRAMQRVGNPAVGGNPSRADTKAAQPGAH